MTITWASNEVHQSNVFVVYKKKHYTVIFFVFLIDFNFVILIIYYYMTLILRKGSLLQLQVFVLQVRALFFLDSKALFSEPNDFIFKFQVFNLLVILN
jgi:hypothetical protein